MKTPLPNDQSDAVMKNRDVTMNKFAPSSNQLKYPFQIVHITDEDVISIEEKTRGQDKGLKSVWLANNRL